MRAAGVVAALAFATAAGAQTVTLSGWNVPPGMAVCSASRHDLSTRTTVSDRPTVHLEETGRSETCWQGFDVRDGHLVGADELVTSFEIREQPAGRVQSHPRAGVRARIEREPGRPWHAHTADWSDRTYGFALDDAFYPATPVAVGASWAVADSVVAGNYGPLVAGTPIDYTVRIDSVGVREGTRVAFVSHEGTFTAGTAVQPVAARITRRAAIDLSTTLERWVDVVVVVSWSSVLRDGRAKPGRQDVRVTQRVYAERTVLPEDDASVGPGE